MATYHLYNTLNVNISSSKDLTCKEKEHVVKCINQMKPAEMDAVYLLIYQYHLLTNPTAENIKPYSIKTLGCNISYNLDDLPISLKRILLKFCTVVQEK